MAVLPISNGREPGGPEAGSRHILVVDQERAESRELAANLAEAGYSVDYAGTAGRALERIRESEVELILLGEELPGMAGLDLLRLLRAAWTPQQLPVIMLAGGEADVETEALEAGANDCISPSGDGGRALARVRSQFQLRDAGQGVRERAERVFRATAVSTDVVWEWNITTDAYWFSSEWVRLTGSPAAGLLQLADWLAVVHPDDVAGLHGSLRLLREDPAQLEFTQEYRVVLPGGEIKWIYCRANVERDRNGRLLRVTGLQTDITRNKSIDWLTQLPNRENVLERADRMLAGQVRSTPFALVLLDLDRFRVINESLGATVGDRVLREVAMRLERVTRTVSLNGRPADFLARVHGDTFLLILNDLHAEDLARAVADRLQITIRRPLHIGGREIRLSASIGIVMSTGDAYERGFEMLRDGEIALHAAKTLGGARSISFRREMRAEAMDRMDLEIDLRHALERRELVLHYQPKIHIETGRLAGFEALLRWNHQRLGLVPPLRFIPIAEEAGLIIPIGAWALDTAARQFAAWRAMAPGRPLDISVNLSVKQFFDRDLVDQVGRLVQELELPAGTFGLEVTESVLIGEMQKAADVLRRLHAAGAGLLIDDFGTGYSSLNYLASLPFDSLKIDRTFIARLEQDESCTEVVRAVISLARNLKLDVVAEGVETEGQLECLRRLECPHVQGYYYSKPVDAKLATEMLQRPA
jgi:diguanylate cyclase (GGDEF)-like protein